MVRNRIPYGDYMLADIGVYVMQWVCGLHIRTQCVNPSHCLIAQFNKSYPLMQEISTILDFSSQSLMSGERGEQLGQLKKKHVWGLPF